jgi:hypothetical protein
VLRRLRIENLVLIREADLAFAPGLSAITGETGAGKTILAQAIGLLLGSRGDASLVGPDATEAYVEAELEPPPGFFDDESLAGLAELRPEDEEGLVLARRVFSDGRTRAYAWGRSAAREDLPPPSVDDVACFSSEQPPYHLRRPLRGRKQVARRRCASYGEAQRSQAQTASWRKGHRRGGAVASCGRSSWTAGTRTGRRGRLVPERLRYVIERRGRLSGGEALAPEAGRGYAGSSRWPSARSLTGAFAPTRARRGDLRDAELRLRRRP